MEERSRALRGVCGSGQVGVGETEDEELVGIGDLSPLRQGTVCRKSLSFAIQRVWYVVLPLLHVGAEADAFDLGGNLAGGDAVVVSKLNDIEEQRLADRVVAARRVHPWR